jgi:hypothetical protein
MSAKTLVQRFKSANEDVWLSREDVAQICPSCATKMASKGISKVRASVLFSDERLMTAALGRMAKGWGSLPKGWTQASLKSFWESLTGDRKHKVTACISKLKGSEGVDDPGAFCASLADRLEPGWRSER